MTVQRDSNAYFAPKSIPPTSAHEADRAAEGLHGNKAAWLRVPRTKRIEYLRSCMHGVADVARKWVADSCKLKGIDPAEPLAGEEWLAGPAATVRYIRLLLESIEAIESGAAKQPSEVRVEPNGQHVARVFPEGAKDRVLYGGMTAEVWMTPGALPEQGLDAYKGRDEEQRDRTSDAGGIDNVGDTDAGGVCLVLGGGNVSSIAPLDVLYKLFVENQVVLLKMNPVNAFLGVHVEDAFRVLIDAGFLAVVYGGPEVGAELAEHALVDALHLTGSDRTYDAIVWGSTEEERTRRKAANDPKIAGPSVPSSGA